MIATACALAPMAETQTTGNTTPCASAEHRQFDFWFGDW
jgi:hypothetical protein